ncbi:formate dehydrogenase accessory sulfurtransferase FdhD [Phenylobacterium deserti]|uniref:Sulfur carrier protein FdhD n=1 Tax=Phenylobacterium deserti TaxID=1914756 RepID=A0A328ADH6_9CAUL|nr:formate dehydrogenase accessory sulfurtransferase FdhD [Phenylobacterium deserti]RAK52276.1 formate dehydrogenase accessory sulfurtransferase FdhD [Phenylobacterium deserti]
MNVTTTSLLPRLSWTAGGPAIGERMVAEEAPVALVHNGSTTAVMMATPADLEDFAIGFSLTEGLVSALDQIRDVEAVRQAEGIEARVWLDAATAAKIAMRRRKLAGPTGCGLCGVESLAASKRSTSRVEAQGFSITPESLLRGMSAMTDRQTLGHSTRAAHAAGFWQDETLVAVREDVGRHNALDKLVGALARKGASSVGAVLLTSRVSVEMVQKVAAFGAPVICAVSAPTTLAVRTADEAGVTLIAVCRADGFEVFTHGARVDLA